jgi:hypothetical protein
MGWALVSGMRKGGLRRLFLPYLYSTKMGCFTTPSFALYISLKTRDLVENFSIGGLTRNGQLRR